MKKIYSIYQMALRSFTADGTLRSAEELLPYLAENGFDIIYLCSVFEADGDSDTATWSNRQKASGTYNPKNPYKMRDYFNVDVEYGTNEDLKSFVDTAHKLGLRVMLDLVYLHCGVNAVFAHEHPEYLVCGEDGRPIVGADWPFARLNFECEGLREYLWSNMEYYVRDFGVDGYRCDVGDLVPLDFWREGVRRVRAIDPDIVMLNEGARVDYNEVFDLCYQSYGFAKIALSDDPANALALQMSAENKNYFGQLAKRSDYSGHTISFIENHDVASDNRLDRYERTAGHGIADITYVLMYTLDGVPFVFNGNEIGDSAEQCMFSNRFHGKRAGIDWSNALKEHGKRRLELIRSLNRARREHDALLFGDVTVIGGMPEKALVYTRMYSGERVTVAVNTGEDDRYIMLDIGDCEIIACAGADISSNGIILHKHGYAVLAGK